MKLMESDIFIGIFVCLLCVIFVGKDGIICSWVV